MSKENPTPGDAIEDEYYANAGVRTGSAYNEYLVSQREQRKRGGGGGGKGGGGGMLLLGLLALGLVYVVAAGYVLCAELVSHYWTGYNLSDHNWTLVGIYAAASVAGVAVVSRFWGLLPGILFGLIPAIPLYFSALGGFGFWYIVHNNIEEVMDNLFTSWVALIGMVSIHVLIARLAQRRDGSLWQRLLRWRWIRSPVGVAATFALVCVGGGATYVILEAMRRHTG